MELARNVLDALKLDELSAVPWRLTILPLVGVAAHTILDPSVTTHTKYNHPSHGAARLPLAPSVASRVFSNQT